jgi:glucose/arabinose dehydrogenase
MKSNKSIFIAFLISGTFFTACGNNPPSENTTSVISDPIVGNTENPSVETRDPNADYKPAFNGQTRVGAVKTTTPFDARIITKELNQPWGIAVLPDGRFLITEKKGTMRIASMDGKVSEEIKGIPKVNSDGQGGLLGLAIDPAFQKNRFIYWAFSEETPEGNLTSIAKGKLASDEKMIQNAAVIYRATPAYDSDLHYGSRILFDKSGNLIFSTGERSDKQTRPQSQYLNSSLGKIIRITTEGKPAPGNPVFKSSSAKPEIYSYGHRNVQGLAFHPVTGELWENEFGPRGGDELNRIEPGKNYGWPVISYGLEYSGNKIGDGLTQQAGMEQPVYYWDPVLSPSGMTFYTGDLTEWKNNLFICGLNSNHIARLVIENNKVTGEERILADENQRFRDITQGKDGALYCITDEGRLYRIGKK